MLLILVLRDSISYLEDPASEAEVKVPRQPVAVAPPQPDVAVKVEVPLAVEAPQAEGINKGGRPKKDAVGFLNATYAAVHTFERESSLFDLDGKESTLMLRKLRRLAKGCADLMKKATADETTAIKTAMKKGANININIHINVNVNININRRRSDRGGRFRIGREVCACHC